MDEDTELLERRSRSIAKEVGVMFSPKPSSFADLPARLYASPAKHVTAVPSIPSPLSPLRTLNFDEYIDQTGQISNINLSVPLAGFIDPQIAQMSELHADQIRQAVTKFGEQQRRINRLTTELARLRACEMTTTASGKDQSRDDDFADLQSENERLQQKVLQLQQDLDDLGNARTAFQDRGDALKKLEQQLTEQENELVKLQRDMDHQTSQFRKQQDELHMLREKCADQEHRLSQASLKLQTTQQEVHRLRGSRADVEMDRGRLLAKDKEIAELRLARDQYVSKLDKSEQLRQATQRLLRKYYDLYHDLAVQVETMQTDKEAQALKLETELTDAIAKISSLDLKYKSAAEANRERQREIDALTTQLRTKSQQLSREREALAHKDILHDAIRQELSDLKRRSHEYSNLHKELEETKLKALQSSKIANDLNDAQLQIAELQALVAAMLEIKSQSSKLQRDVETIRAEMMGAKQELEVVHSQLDGTNRDLESEKRKTRSDEQALETMTMERDAKEHAIAALGSDLESRDRIISHLQETLAQKEEELKTMRGTISHLEHNAWQAVSDRDGAIAKSRELDSQLDSALKTNKSNDLSYREISTNLEQQIKAHQERTYVLEQEQQVLKNELQELQKYNRTDTGKNPDRPDHPHQELTPPRGDHDHGNGLNHLQSTIVDDVVEDVKDTEHHAQAEHWPTTRQNVDPPAIGNKCLALPASVAQAEAGSNENAKPAGSARDTHQARIALDVYVRSDPSHSNEPARSDPGHSNAPARPSLEPHLHNSMRTSCTPATSITRGNNSEYGLLW